MKAPPSPLTDSSVTEDSALLRRLDGGPEFLISASEIYLIET